MEDGRSVKFILCAELKIFGEILGGKTSDFFRFRSREFQHISKVQIRDFLERIASIKQNDFIFPKRAF